MRKVASILFSVLLVAAAFVGNVAAQPQVAYITPDAGAPGMCVVVEIIAPESAHGTFGADISYLALTGQDTIVNFVRASDSALIRLGPAVVSWDGREISQMLMIEPNVPTLDTSVNLVVYFNGQKSAPFTFHILKPRHLGFFPTWAFMSSLRTARNTLVVDSVIEWWSTGGGTTDPDPITPGDQSYLPLRILSQGPIRFHAPYTGPRVFGSGGSINSPRSGGSGGFGGGGGGGGYPAKGGNGYTGGGGNADGTAGPGGAGSGSISGSNSYDGGKGLSGVAGGLGELHPGSSSSGPDDGGGGGTGHPFGSSGQSGTTGNSNDGGFGGGSGGGSTTNYLTDYGGGGGGYATWGSAGGGSPTNNGGHPHGNPMLVPLAGGSGGGAGNNTYTTFGGNTKGGSGGGGGGAVELVSFASIDLQNDIMAMGGWGSDAVQGLASAAGGGGGSGGAIVLDARDSIDISSDSKIDVSGGQGGLGQNNGGAGGLGCVRINGYVSKVNGNTSSTNFYTPSKDYTGPSIQRVIQMKDSLIIIGHAKYWDGVPSSPLRMDVRWQWSHTAEWKSCSKDQPWCPTLINDPASHTAMWRDTIPISQDLADTVVYIVAVQRETPVSGSIFHSDVPSEVMSHTSGIIVKVLGAPQAAVRTNVIDFGNVRIGRCSKDTTIKVYSVGKSELAVTSLRIVGPDASQFTIKTSTPKYVKPKDSVTVTLQFCPTQLKCPMFDTLRIFTTDSSRDIVLRGCGVNPQASITPLLVDFGIVRLGECKDTTVRISNTGTDVLTVTRESIGDTAHFKILDPLPQMLAPSASFSLHLRFCPTDVPVVTSYDTVESDAAQSPIIVQLRGGGKIGVLSIPLQLDFGQVAFDSCKDSGIVVRNIGNDSLAVSQQTLFLSNDFHYVGPALPISLGPNDTALLHFQFCSPDTGNFRALDSLYADQNATQRWGGLELVAHTGVGILSTLTTIDFGGVVVGGCRDTIVTLRNTGTGKLFVDSIPNLSSEFTVVSGLPAAIEPLQTATIRLRYCPSTEGPQSATSIIVVDTPSKNSPLTLTGTGLKGALSTSGPVDFGCLPQGTTVSKKITVQNTGTGTLSGVSATIQPAGTVTIVHQPPSSLPNGASDSVLILLSAAQLGDLSVTLLISWDGGGPLSVPITAHVAVPPTIVSLDTLVTFDSVTIGDSSIVKCIRVMNPSCVSLKADHVLIFNNASQQFEIVSSDAATLVDSSVATICVRYKPSRIDTASATLVLKSGSTSYTIGRVTGTGRANPTSVQLALDTVFGRPGQTVNMRVHATNDVTAAGITSVTFRLQFDPMQLDMKVPVAAVVSGIQSANAGGLSYSVKKYSLGDQEITANYPSSLTGLAGIAAVPFEILLPTTSVAKIHLLSASFGTAPASLASAADGEIRIEQCDTNERISIDKAPVSIAQNNPNPFNPRTSIRVDVQEAGHMQIEVYNALGVRVMTLFDGEISVGTKLVEIDGSTLASGAYHYFTTWSNGVRTVRDEKTMVLVK